MTSEVESDNLQVIGVWSLELIGKGSWSQIHALVKRSRCDTLDYLDMLELSDPDTHEKLVEFLFTFAEKGPPRNRTKFKQVRKNLFEMKVGRARLFSFFHPTERRWIIITHGWDKRSSRKQTNQIDRSIRVRDDYIAWLTQQK